MHDLPGLLESLSKTVPATSLTDGLLPDSAAARWLQEQYVDEKNGEVGVLVEALKKHRPNKALRTGSIAQSPLSSLNTDLYRMAANWCLAQSRKRSAVEVICELDSFVENDSVSMLEVLVLWGIHPAQSIPLTKDLNLVKLVDLGSSQYKDYFEGRKNTNYGMNMGPANPKPQAALTKHVSFRPFRDAFQSDEFARESEKIGLSEIASLLPIVVNRSVCKIAHWFECSPSMPFIGGVQTCGWHGTEHAFLFGISETDYDSADMQNIVEDYLNLPCSLRTRIRTPLDRLNRAYRESNPTQKAIELGIAAESLLADDKQSDAPISYVLRQRAAVFIGDSSADRKEIFDLFKKMYDLRSKAVHGHELPFRIQKTSILTIDFLQRVAHKISELIRKIIRLGAWPDWESLVMRW